MYLKEFHELVPEIDRRAREFLANPQIIPELLEKACTETAYIKYGLYKHCMVRGTMCPDAFYEMDKSFTRGRLVNKQPNREEYHRYGFNENDQLLYSEWESYVPHVEVILREGQFVWGLDAVTTEPLSPAFMTIFGNYIENNRIVADFRTDLVLLEKGHIISRLMHYENGVPVRYIMNATCTYERDANGLPVNITNPYPLIMKLYVNRSGDVIRICRIKNEFEEGNPEQIHSLAKPVPRVRWENRYGLW